jgi:hypothetical protein
MNSKSVNNAESGSGFTTSAPEIAPGPARSPEFYPLPKASETLEGLRRGSLYALWKAGEIQMISVRLRGKARGRRLVCADSLHQYLRRLRQEQCAAAAQVKGGIE